MNKNNVFPFAFVPVHSYVCYRLLTRLRVLRKLFLDISNTYNVFI